ncbi:MAG: hypothetical protein KBT11_02320, partial [Treponema sp.]|nr:hypothetical protein [Candidatus Treponema equifaecale]
LNSREKWGILLRDADKPDKLEMVKQVAQPEEGIMAAFNVLGGISLTQRLWLWQTKRMVREADRISDLEGAKDIAREEGFNDGAFSKAVETAKNLLKLNVLTPEQISQTVGLTLEQVHELEGNLH